MTAVRGGAREAGEAIIDAFADVQKLFQHVVEAAHMEGAAFEASRRQDEMNALRQQVAAAANGGIILDVHEENSVKDNSNSNGPTRHDEFVDQDVKDVLTEAIRQGTKLREDPPSGGQDHDDVHLATYQLYEQACQSASALLPWL